MSAHHVEITLAQDGKLMLDEFAFSCWRYGRSHYPGPSIKPNGREYPLRGQPIKYLKPTEPVAQVDWDAIQ